MANLYDITGRASARARGDNGGKIINTVLLIPASALYTTTGVPVLQGGPNLTL